MPYGEVPPDHETWTEIDCPLSIVVADGAIVGVPRAVLTVTVSPDEHDDAAGVPCDESVTL